VSVSRRPAAQAVLALDALGVVFGDIEPVVHGADRVQSERPAPGQGVARQHLRIVSLIFWSVTVIVTVTYILLVMRADNDNDGEVGIMALIALIRRQALPGARRAKAMLAALGIFGPRYIQERREHRHRRLSPGPGPGRRAGGGLARSRRICRLTWRGE
jgi:KUP system potassium uptake protein